MIHHAACSGGASPARGVFVAEFVNDCRSVGIDEAAEAQQVLMHPSVVGRQEAARVCTTTLQYNSDEKKDKVPVHGGRGGNGGDRCIGSRGNGGELHLR